MLRYDSCKSKGIPEPNVQLEILSNLPKLVGVCV